MARPEPRRRRHPVADWLARGAVVAGGFMLLRSTGGSATAATAPAVPIEQQGAEIGRGNPAAPPSRSALKAGHETRELSGRTLTLLVVGLGSTVACVIGLMVLFVGYLERSREAALPAFTAQQTTVIPPPEPNLQAAPLQDIAALRAHADDLLSNYAWRDEARTRARIPIERAKVLVLGRPLETAP